VGGSLAGNSAPVATTYGEITSFPQRRERATNSGYKCFGYPVPMLIPRNAELHGTNLNKMYPKIVKSFSAWTVLPILSIPWPSPRSRLITYSDVELLALNI
jgi:hypothetical protein